MEEEKKQQPTPDLDVESNQEQLPEVVSNTDLVEVQGDSNLPEPETVYVPAKVEESDIQTMPNIETVYVTIAEEDKKVKEKYFSAKRITWFSVLLALTLIFGIWGSYIKIGPTTISLVLVPIVLSGIMLGIIAGTVMGFIFGLIVILFNGLIMPDGFTSYLLVEQPALLVLTCLLKGTMAGLIPAVIYRLMKKKHRYIGTFLASASAPIMNTGIFILGGLCMSGTLTPIANGNGNTLIYFLVIGCAGVNFLIEFALNLILAPAVYRVTEIIEKHLHR